MNQQRKIFIDCGANMGTGFSKLCEQVGVDHTWEVFAFEPNEHAFDGYVENIKSEKFSCLNDKNINVFQKAVWIEDGEIEFCMEGLNEREYTENELWKQECDKHVKNYPLERLELGVPSCGGSCIKEMHEKLERGEDHEKLFQWSEPVLVECIDFSKWIKDSFSKDDYIFVKMDVEGSEYKILPKMIEDNSIQYINSLVIEWHDWVMPEFKSETSKLSNQLSSLGINLLSWG
jgi:FkbM family methyltransferase